MWKFILILFTVSLLDKWKRTEVQVLLVCACFWLYTSRAYCQDGTRAIQTKLIPEYGGP